MKHIKQYNYTQSSDIEKIVKSVADLIAQGWQPYGELHNVLVRQTHFQHPTQPDTSVTHFEYMHQQVMVKYAD